jgi:hypothetical protein
MPKCGEQKEERVRETLSETWTGLSDSIGEILVAKKLRFVPQWVWRCLKKRTDTVGQPLLWFLMVQIEVLKSSDHDEHFRRKNAKEAHAFGMDMTRDFFINILRKIFL